MNGKQPTTVARSLPADMRASKGYFARSVGAFVPKVVAAAFEKFGFHTAEIMTSWHTIVGADLGRLARPNAIKWPRGTKARAAADDGDVRSAGATLIVDVDPAFALEISYRTQEIIDRINRYFGYRAIGQLRVIQAPKAAQSGITKPVCQPMHTQARRPKPPSSLPAEDLSAALEALARNVTAARAR